jgi:azurin
LSGSSNATSSGNPSGGQDGGSSSAGSGSADASGTEASGDGDENKARGGSDNDDGNSADNGSDGNSDDGSGATGNGAESNNNGGGGNSGGDGASGDSSQAVTKKDGVYLVKLTGDNMLQYNIDKFTVPAGAEVRIDFKNVGAGTIRSMGHNVVILERGKNPVSFGTQCATKGSVKNDYLPESMRGPVIAHTDLIAPGKRTSITFQAPEKSGDYPYVCTFIGHSATMNGTMKVK